ncbi:SsgA family sporulation/cell division regulator [Streptomyces sp. NPDC058335]|uniref:SsgA family sporulation/cell division regulator n=1 Tax=Streptomyces sp. NPDC058335 TaxID=3346451 RepID=UPI0036646C43
MAWGPEGVRCSPVRYSFGAGHTEVLPCARPRAFSGKTPGRRILESWQKIRFCDYSGVAMARRLGTVTRAMTAHVNTLNRPPVPVPAELHYETATPYAIRLCLGVSTGSPVTWVFARELLAEGLRRPAGLGDVRVVPRRCHHPHSLRVVLSNSAGTALVDLPTAETTDFLQQAFTLVPAGTEDAHMDLDRGIAELVGECS